MDEVSELQKRRAINIIWNAARDYSFSPDFKAFDADGRAELYWNCIIGAVRRHYEYAKLAKVFASFAQYEESDCYEGLLWLGLENCVFLREVRERPAIAALRREYAERFVAAYGSLAPEDFHLYEHLAYAHFCRVLGREDRENPYDRKLLDELEFGPDLSTDEIVERAKSLFQQWFQINTEAKKREFSLPLLSLRRRPRGKIKKRYRKFAIGLADHPEHLYSEADGNTGAETESIRTHLTAEELRSFMAEKYGKPLYDRRQIGEIERRLCTGNHTNCHLHFTRGEPVPGHIRNGFEALQKEREAAQIERNRRYYQEHLAQNYTAVRKLTEKIQNSVLLHLQPSPVKANAGSLCGGRVWRATRLGDERVFIRDEQGNMGDLSVDILLDASTSQKRRQEIVSNQGYIIAEALSLCGIPCRVSAFCSMTGYTIMRIYRDYNEQRGSNRRIFEYVSNGCNRDGLAIRAMHYLMSQGSCEHKILIILSDVKPNDIRRIQTQDGSEPIPYEGGAGVTDTAYEVRRARAEGIAVICVFTGEDEDLPAARTVYGRDFARIRSIDQLADTVGLLIQNQIKNI